jgi:capsular polysaccharide biosynthesis protein
MMAAVSMAAFGVGTARGRRPGPGARSSVATDRGDTTMARTDHGAARHRAERAQDARGFDVLAAVSRHTFLIVACAIVLAAAAYFAATMQPHRYTAQATLFMSTSSSFDGVGGGSFVNDPDRYISNQAGVVASGPVLAAAVKAGAADDVEELRRQLDVAAALGKDEIRIRAEGATPKQAVARADAVAQAYRDFSQAAVKAQTDKLVELSTTAAERAEVLKRAAVFGDGVAFAELATPPDAPSSPTPLRDGLFGLIAGLVLGTGIALLLEARARRRLERSERAPKRQAPAGRAHQDAGRRAPGATPDAARYDRDDLRESAGSPR